VCAALLQKPGVAGYFGAKVVPGGNDMGAVVHDEECFASEVVTCIGQPIGVVVADTEQHARMAARLVKVEYEDLPALISIEDAIEAKSFYEVRHSLVLVMVVMRLSCCRLSKCVLSCKLALACCSSGGQPISCSN